MEVNVKIFSELHSDCESIRKAVFMDEQGFRNEFDGNDERS